MSRYTKKIKNSYCEYLPKDPYFLDLIGADRKNLEDTYDAELSLLVDKLGKLEDLEEELGCPLEVLIKPLLEGGIIENDGYGAQLNGLAINGDGSLSLTAINGDHYDLKDYQKTWWLKGEKDEKRNRI